MKSFVNDDATEINRRFVNRGCAVITGGKDLYLQSDDSGGSTDNTEEYTELPSQLIPTSFYTQLAPHVN